MLCTSITHCNSCTSHVSLFVFSKTQHLVCSIFHTGGNITVYQLHQSPVVCIPEYTRTPEIEFAFNPTTTECLSTVVQPLTHGKKRGDATILLTPVPSGYTDGGPTPCNSICILAGTICILATMCLR